MESGVPDVGNNQVVSTNPVILTVAPTAAPRGGTVIINGIGFSIVPEENIVFTGGAGVSAQSWGLLDPPVNGASETITFQVPQGAAIGTGPIFVTLTSGLTTNTDIQFTVAP
ncbi:MAG: IPT/TIG domain-containing protein [Deltaproteobacteria bacterium]|nr:IPT/TIG domain-containing protein [Deltaproteobacteria bacterium]